MAKKHLFKYESMSAYNADAANRDNTSVSVADSSLMCNADNVILDYTEANCEPGDMIVYDTELNRRMILKMATYNAATLDTTRYIVSDCIFFMSEMGVGISLHKGYVSTSWAAQCEFKLSGLDLTQNGSFKFMSTGVGAAASATTISWIAGDSLTALKARFTTAVIGNATYNSVTVLADGLLFMVGGYGTNLITITDATGGATDFVLTDYSKYCKIGNSPVAAGTHRSFQGSAVATCFPDLASRLHPVETASYTKSVANRPYRCGMNFARFKTYVSNSGSTTFVDSTTDGAVLPMKEAKFNACASSQVAAEVACYNRFGGSWDAYLKAAMVDIDAVWGCVGRSFMKHGEQGDILASIFYQSHDGSWKPCYPAAYQTSQLGISAIEGVTTGFEQGNMHLADCMEGSAFMEDSNLAKINGSLAKIGGSALSNSAYYWFSQEYVAGYAWLYSGNDGTLYNYNYRVFGFVARACLALEFNS